MSISIWLYVPNKTFRQIFLLIYGFVDNAASFFFIGDKGPGESWNL